MVLKYLVNDYPIQTLYFGIANVVANGLVMLRYVVPQGFANGNAKQGQTPFDLII